MEKVSPLHRVSRPGGEVGWTLEATGRAARQSMYSTAWGWA